MKKKFEIIHDDDAIVVINKSPGVLTIPDRFKPELFNLYNWLDEVYEKIFVVHRLDKGTSGVMVFAKTEAAHKHLSEQFNERSVEKIYTVLVDGVVHEPEGIIEKPIGRDPGKPGRMIVTDSGKYSLTKYKVTGTYKNYTLLEADLKTGRTHQVRVHFQSVGYPLAVDKMYGRNAAFFLSRVKGNKYHLGKNKEERPLMSRTSLHAFRLSFLHPLAGNRVTFEAAMPKDFRAVINQLDKWGK